jgi:hypothetical protein
LADVFGIDPAKVSCERTVRNVYGKGRVVYIPKIIPSVEPPKPAWDVVPRYRWINSRYWHLPKNWKELVNAVEWSMGGELPLYVKAPETVTVEFLQQKESKRFLLHLLNYDFKTRVKYIDIELKMPRGKRIESVSIDSPDSETIKGNIPCKENARYINFTVPILQIYNIVLIKYQEDTKS